MDSQSWTELIHCSRWWKVDYIERERQFGEVRIIKTYIYSKTDRQTDRDRQDKDRNRDRQRQRDRDRATHRETDRDRKRESERSDHVKD